MIHHLSHNQIDKQRWDQTILNSEVSYYYALSWYLDAISPNWSALVSTDYQQVMPLTIKYKWGVLPHLSQAPFAQQLGVFGKGSFTVDDFIAKFPSYLLKIDYQFHHQERPQSIPVTERINYIIPLDADYDTLLKRYHKDKMRYSVRKSKELNPEVLPYTNFAHLVDLYLNGMMAEKLKVDANYYHYLYTNFEILEHYYPIEAYVIKEDETILAGLVAVHYQDQIAFLATYNSALGRERYSLYRLWDYFIENYANTGKFINVQGTDHPTVGLFYRRFGALEQKYYRYQKNIFKI